MGFLVSRKDVGRTKNYTFDTFFSPKMVSVILGNPYRADVRLWVYFLFQVVFELVFVGIKGRGVIPI